MKKYHNSPCFVDNCGADAATRSHRRRGPGPDARRPAEPPASRGLDGPRDRCRPSLAVPRRPAAPLRRRRARHADRHGCRGGGRRRRRGARGATGVGRSARRGGRALAAAVVARPLAAGDLDAARAAVGLHLVSRPTATLGPDEVASATIESLAENLTDAVIAPVCFYLLFGLAGAAAYRAVNTVDAMLGYRDGALEWFGKLAARLDDVLNFVPARLAALGLLAGAAAAGEDARGALRMLGRDGALTASPNAGRTMAAMAGALGLTLAKRGAYRLGEGRPPRAADIARAVRVFAWAAALSLGALLVLDSLVLFLRGGHGPLGMI